MIRASQLFFTIVACSAAACTEPRPAVPGGDAVLPGPGRSGTASSTAGLGRMAQIRSLLALEPQSRIRAEKLYPLVDPVCREAAPREAFVAEVAAIAGRAPDEEGDALAAIEAIDVLEHVATACARNDLPAAHDLLTRAIARLPKVARLHEIDARLAAAGGDLAGAHSAAKAARALGSIHAIPLIATISAQLARDRAVGYRPGMLDEALATVSIEPESAWSLIDLTAVLTTRARLLSERALWEPPAERKKTLEQAHEVYQRLAGQPFIETTRTHALDMRCFDGVDLGEGPKACETAATEAGILGAAFVTSLEDAKDKIDTERLEAVRKVQQRLGKIAPGATVVLIARGDESELIAWARPAAELLLRFRELRARLVLLDRTSGPRAGAVADRILELAGTKPAERIDAQRDTFAVGCFAAILAGRKTPASCPFEPALVERLQKHGPLAAAVLVGRDLDAEIEDLHLYQLPALLLSFRRPATDDPVEAHLKSVSDVLLLSPRSKGLW